MAPKKAKKPEEQNNDAQLLDLLKSMNITTSEKLEEAIADKAKLREQLDRIQQDLKANREIVSKQAKEFEVMGEQADTFITLAADPREKIMFDVTQEELDKFYDDEYIIRKRYATKNIEKMLRTNNRRLDEYITAIEEAQQLARETYIKCEVLESIVQGRARHEKLMNKNADIKRKIRQREDEIQQERQRLRREEEESKNVRTRPQKRPRAGEKPTKSTSESPPVKTAKSQPASSSKSILLVDENDSGSDTSMPDINMDDGDDGEDDDDDDDDDDVGENEFDVPPLRRVLMEATKKGNSKTSVKQPPKKK